MIKKKIRTIKNEKRRHNIASILSTSRGLKNTTFLKTRRKNILMTRMQGEAGNNKFGRQNLADVFAKLCEELCTSTTKTHEHQHEDK